MLQYKDLSGHESITIFRSCSSLMGRPLMWAHFLLVDNIFIDTGAANCNQKRLKRFLAGLDKNRNWKIINTHLHEDHCGNNALIQNILDADIYAPRKRTNFDDVSLLYKMYWGKPKMFKHQVFSSDNLLTDKGRRIQIIPAPGHTPCQVCFLIENNNILVTGDTSPLASNKTYCMPEENFPDAVASLKKIEKLITDDMTVFDGHFGVLSNPKEHINIRVKNMDEVIRKVKAANKKYPDDMKKIIREAFGKPRKLDPLLESRISHKYTVASIIN